MQLAKARPAIDLTRSHFHRDIGDLSIFGTWLYNDDQEDTEPCLVVIPRYRTIGFRPCVIALSAAFRYNDPRYLARAARYFADQLGFEDEMTTVRKIATLIHDHMLDLLSMPLDPTEAVVIGEASIDVGNGRRRAVEILDHEQTKQV